MNTQSAVGAKPVPNIPGLLIAILTAFPVMADELEDWKQDLSAYRVEVLDPDPSFSEQQRATANELLTDLENRLGELSRAAIELALAEVSALAQNGHSFLMPGGWTHRFNRLPVKFVVFSDGIFITIAHDDHRQLVGSKLVSIDGHGIGELKQFWSRHQGGLEGWRNQYLPYLLESPEVLFAAGMANSADQVRLRLQNADGIEEEIVMKPRTDLPPLEGMDLYLAPSRLLQAAMISAPGYGETPLYLDQAGRQFRYLFLPELDSAYIQFKANSDVSDQDDIAGFIRKTSNSLRKSRPANIILDERFNYGGDLNITRNLMQEIPRLTGAGGKVYAIVSGRTFSAGISSVAYLKQAAGDQLVIVGEPVGDNLEFWAEGDLKVLPNSGIAFLMATERHNYVTGCQEDDCHGAVKRNPIRVPTLEPDYLTPLTYSEFARNSDPAMEKISALIGQ